MPGIVVVGAGEDVQDVVGHRDIWSGEGVEEYYSIRPG
jgi:hypothetical protein